MEYKDTFRLDEILEQVKYMDNDTLRKLQMSQLEIAKEIKRVCDILGIDYFLDAGTLLGAVRHQGFIPWDDDLDIGMLRSDYDRFVNEAGKILGNQFFLQTCETDLSYGLTFAKVRKNGTIYLEETAIDCNAHNGVYVDIFPYDDFPMKKSQQNEQRRKLFFIRRAILQKCGYKPWLVSSKNAIVKITKGFLYWWSGVFTIPYSKNQLFSQYEKIAQKYNGVESDILFKSDGASDYGAWLIKKECVSKTILLLFEGEMFKCPIGYIDYLISIYGNYLELPPVEERCNRHKIVKLQL